MAARAWSRSSTSSFKSCCWRSPPGISNRTAAVDAAYLQRFEPCGADQPFDCRSGVVVVSRVEERRPRRRAVRAIREHVRGERAERLYVVRARWQERGDDRSGRLSFRQCPKDLPILVEPERVRGIDHDLVLEEARVLRDQFLDRVQPDGEDDDVRGGHRVFDGGGARERSELLRQRFRVRFVLRGQNNGFVAGYKMPGKDAPEVADPDDCGCQPGSFPSFVPGRDRRLRRRPLESRKPIVMRPAANSSACARAAPIRPRPLPARRRWRSRARCSARLHLGRARLPRR